ncbi:MAG TPA: AmmeMemoRadiSam system protein B [Bryobacteraceae bacterium]
MSEVLPRLRFNLDFMPSPDPAKPGLYIRDPYHYSDTTLLVPPQLVQVLECFDGEQSTLDLRSELVRITGEIEVGDLEKHLFDALDEAGFLDNDRYRQLKTNREAEFAGEVVREPNFAGSAYPAHQIQLAELLTSRIGGPQGSASTVGIAAPHASPDGGWDTYRAAYRCLPPLEDASERTFVILGTSHYGAPERFGLTRKRFATPFGTAQTNVRLVDELAQASDGAVRMEDYCHSVEHSIEFQVVFLQHLYGPQVRILPILCGPFVKSIYEGGLPEENEGVARFLDALANLGAREGKRLFWVLGVDMAHMGRRYNDPLRATANIGEMVAIEQRDRERIGKIAVGDLGGYWSMVQDGHDDLKWCGSSPFYTFMKAMPGLRGELLNYQQWQIDPQSVVSFGAIAFGPRPTNSLAEYGSAVPAGPPKP